MTDIHDLCRDGIRSNCCGAEILMADAEGHGMCADCKEHCGAERECPHCGGDHVEENECEATLGKMD